MVPAPKKLLLLLACAGGERNRFEAQCIPLAHTLVSPRKAVFGPLTAFPESLPIATTIRPHSALCGRFHA